MTKIGCDRCRADPQPKHFGSPRNCAFLDDGSFTTDNWACASLGEVRELSTYQSGHDRGHPDRKEPIEHYPLEVWNNEDHLAVIPVFGDDVIPDGDMAAFIVLLFYKHRGRTSQAWVMSEAGLNRPLRLDDVERYLASRGVR